MLSNVQVKHCWSISSSRHMSSGYWIKRKKIFVFVGFHTWMRIILVFQFNHLTVTYVNLIAPNKGKNPFHRIELNVLCLKRPHIFIELTSNTETQKWHKQILQCKPAQKVKGLLHINETICGKCFRYDVFSSQFSFSELLHCKGIQKTLKTDTVHNLHQRIFVIGCSYRGRTVRLYIRQMNVSIKKRFAWNSPSKTFSGTDLDLILMMSSECLRAS